jgi:hypothetical protein
MMEKACEGIGKPKEQGQKKRAATKLLLDRRSGELQYQATFQGQLTGTEGLRL